MINKVLISIIWKVLFDNYTIKKKYQQIENLITIPSWSTVNTSGQVWSFIFKLIKQKLKFSLSVTLLHFKRILLLCWKILWKAAAPNCQLIEEQIQMANWQQQKKGPNHQYMATVITVAEYYFTLTTLAEQEKSKSILLAWDSLILTIAIDL